MRIPCKKCLQPDFGCYCEEVKPFNPGFQFVILIHPIEARKRIATGRMTHLHLENSYLFRGMEFSNHSLFQKILNDPTKKGYVLYPDATSQDVSSPEIQSEFQESKKDIVIFVLDGTWTNAGKILRNTSGLGDLPRIHFQPTRPSQFQVRKQPKPHCLSTIEATHQLIELAGPAVGFDTTTRKHDALIDCFQSLVQKQLHAMERAKELGIFGVKRAGSTIETFLGGEEKTMEY